MPIPLDAPAEPSDLEKLRLRREWAVSGLAIFEIVLLAQIASFTWPPIPRTERLVWVMSQISCFFWFQRAGSAPSLRTLLALQIAGIAYALFFLARGRPGTMGIWLGAALVGMQIVVGALALSLARTADSIARSRAPT